MSPALQPASDLGMVEGVTLSRHPLTMARINEGTNQ